MKPSADTVRSDDDPVVGSVATDAAATTSLRELLDTEGALTPQRAVAVVGQVAAVLDAAATERAVGQRDRVDPANIVIDADDVVDLGEAGGTDATLRPLAYLAPERLTRNAPVTATTDVYALACVLYECLTGTPPFPVTGDLPALIAAHTSADIPAASDRLASIPAGFDEVIARGLAKDPDERYPTAGELADAARRVLEVPDDLADVETEATDGTGGDEDVAAVAESGKPSRPPRRRRKRRRLRKRPRAKRRTRRVFTGRRLAAGVVLAAVLIGAGVEGAVLFQQHREDVAATEALDAAKTFTLALTSIDPEAVDKHFAAVKSRSTGEFKENFTASSQLLRQTLIDNKAASRGMVVDAAVISASTDEVEVMLFIDQSVSNIAAPTPEMDRSRVKMTMEKVNGRWLASKVEVA